MNYFERKIKHIYVSTVLTLLVTLHDSHLLSPDYRLPHTSALMPSLFMRNVKKDILQNKISKRQKHVIRGAWYGGYVLDFRPGGPGSIPGVDVNMN